MIISDEFKWNGNRLMRHSKHNCWCYVEIFWNAISKELSVEPWASERGSMDSYNRNFWWHNQINYCHNSRNYSCFSPAVRIACWRQKACNGNVLKRFCVCWAWGHFYMRKHSHPSHFFRFIIHSISHPKWHYRVTWRAFFMKF